MLCYAKMISLVSFVKRYTALSFRLRYCALFGRGKFAVTPGLSQATGVALQIAAVSTNVHEMNSDESAARRFPQRVLNSSRQATRLKANNLKAVFTSGSTLLWQFWRHAILRQFRHCDLPKGELGVVCQGRLDCRTELNGER